MKEIYLGKQETSLSNKEMSTFLATSTEDIGN